MMPSTLQSVPLSTYLHSEYEPDAEYVDGEIEERPMGENDHSASQLAICAWFLKHAKEWNVFIDRKSEFRLDRPASVFPT